jgi:hypothetical protein
MPTTTNYGWTTPADTDLVKDGAAAIRTLGSSIDTSVKSLNAGTTAGDIDYYTSATAKARVGIGTTGQVLTVSGGVPAWATATAGGMTLLSTTTLSGATVTISSINQTYKSLVGIIYGVTNATATGMFRCAPNGTTNLVAATVAVSYGNGATNTVDHMTDDYLKFTSGTNPTIANANNSYFFQINNYANATNFKSFSSYSGYIGASGGNLNAAQNAAGIIKTNSAITSLVFSNAGGNLSTGTVLLYGVS